MTKPQLQTGAVYQIKFLDHAEDSDDAMVATVFGKVVGTTNRCYQVRSWITANTDEPCNRKSWAIVKSTILDAKLLVKHRKSKDARRSRPC